MMKSISGIPASYGIAIGPAYVFNRVEIVIEPCNIEDPEAELKRYAEARKTTLGQLDEAYLKAKEELGDEAAEIFSAQKLMLEDPELLATVISRVQSELINVETALFETAESYAQQLEAIKDEYLSARALDIRDVSSRCLRNLLGLLDSPAADLKSPSIIVSLDLTPSDTVLLDKENVLGFCTAEGGSTSHTAILARGLGIPAVVGAGQEVEKINTGDDLVIDGDAGIIVIDPDEKALKGFKERQEKFLKIQAEMGIRLKLWLISAVKKGFNQPWKQEPKGWVYFAQNSSTWNGPVCQPKKNNTNPIKPSQMRLATNR